MSRSARRTAESAAIALVLATGAAAGLVAAGLAADDTQAAVIAPAAEYGGLAPAPQAPAPQTLPVPGYQAPAAPHTSRSS